MDGMINVYKEQEFTSFDVVAKLRGILHERKIGHTGTLDPMATGVLPICVGNATKLCDILPDQDKVYETTMVLGVTYDTQDVWGNMLTEETVMSTKTEIEQVIKSFVGGYDQIPPMYSAKKINGKKLYDLAREGKEVERKPSFVDIFSIDILDMDLPRVQMRVHCGKGTYIRALIADIGAKLGCGAAMEQLMRTSVGSFSVEGALKLDEIEARVRAGKIEECIVPTDTVFSQLGSVVVPSELCKLIENGNKLFSEDFDRIDEEFFARLNNGDRFRVYDCNGRFRAVYEFDEKKHSARPYKMFL